MRDLKKETAERNAGGKTTPTTGKRRSRLGWVLMATALAVVLAMIAISVVEIASDDGQVIAAGASPSPSPQPVQLANAYFIDVRTRIATPLPRSIRAISEASNFQASPDGTTLAFEAAGRIYVAGLDGSDIRPISDENEFAHAPAWSPDGEKIVYEGDRARINVIDLASGKRELILDPPRAIFRPSFTSDGDRILFTMLTDNNGIRLWTVAANGGEVRSLPLPLAAFGVYSPDGRMIAFRRSAYDGSDVTEMTHGSVWVARAQGQDPWPLRSADSMSQIDPEALWPAWSPDGKQIAYEPLYGQGVVVDDLRGRRIARFSGTDPSWIDEDTLIIEGYEKPFTATDLLVVDPATGESRPLFALEGHQSNGEVSPDGTRLVYQGGKLSDGPPQIYVLEADGTQRQLTDMPGGAGDPTWSPNGRRIAFVSPINFDAQSDIYVVDADGGDITKLAGTTAYDAAPDWSPDGDEVAFHAYADEPGMPSGIWVASAGDGSLRQLTANGVGDGDSFPVWSPGGGWIAFLRYENAPSHNLEMDDSDFWLMRPDGRGQHRLVAEEGPLASQSLEEWMESTSEWGMSSVDNHFQGAPTWSPDGRRIAWSGGHCDCITIVDVASGKILDTRLYGDFGDPSWSPDGIVVSEPMLVK